jgi:hypothetical protein
MVTVEPLKNKSEIINIKKASVININIEMEKKTFSSNAIE